MELKFPIHFQEKIIERGIDVDQIKQTIRKPDYQTSKPENRILVRKKVGDRTLEVVYAKGGSKNKFIIITAYYLGK